MFGLSGDAKELLFMNLMQTKKSILPLILFLIAIPAVLIFVLKPFAITKQANKPQKELLIYCGITMIQPMSEIASIIEQQEGVNISLIKGGSGNLLRAARFNNIGDLYLPGSDAYIKKATAEGLVTESVHVGYNKAAMMVRKGNPKGIKKNLNELKKPAYMIVIGDPDSGSIGKETKKILTAFNIFDEVRKNSLEFTTDSKRLTEVLKNGDADLVINWYATATWEGNREYIDTIEIDNTYAKAKRLILGLLKSSKHPDIARKFMLLATSEQGREIFNKYGLYHVR